MAGFKDLFPDPIGTIVSYGQYIGNQPLEMPGLNDTLDPGEIYALIQSYSAEKLVAIVGGECNFDYDKRTNHINNFSVFAAFPESQIGAIERLPLDIYNCGEFTDAGRFSTAIGCSIDLYWSIYSEIQFGAGSYAKQLKVAIAAEDFELAAELRDKIRQKENSTSQQ